MHSPQRVLLSPLNPLLLSSTSALCTDSAELKLFPHSDQHGTPHCCYFFPLFCISGLSYMAAAGVALDGLLIPGMIDACLRLAPGPTLAASRPRTGLVGGLYKSNTICAHFHFWPQAPVSFRFVSSIIQDLIPYIHHLYYKSI
ncbi:hypothetical protein M378DRAFT_649375 [Amanita muscaria Koide BX008]|uniref:Uncharacterized protein n=1 Tax=Amanita muscaria (strain Koide BX008) TaxID=946122 RepID=A0A0C2WQ40_AMAMK|nr:hypothetical protein M378DRAFT_649375 [Amanita muscaria Koide BX008]